MVTHAKVSAKSDPADTTLVRPTDWNADHVGGLSHSAASAADYLAQLKLTADTQYRVKLGIDGSSIPELRMGPGGTTAPDVRLKRNAANTFLIDNAAGGNGHLITVGTFYADDIGGGEYTFKVESSTGQVVIGGGGTVGYLLSVGANSATRVKFGVGADAMYFHGKTSTALTIPVNTDATFSFRPTYWNGSASVEMPASFAARADGLGSAMIIHDAPGNEMFHLYATAHDPVGSSAAGGQAYMHIRQESIGDVLTAYRPSEANQRMRLGINHLTWGPGTTTALDTRIRRSGTKTITVDDNAGGAATLNVIGSLQVNGAAVVSSFEGFDVRAYGVYSGGGSVDDTATILAALAATGIRGGRIVIPPSTPKVSATLSIGRNQRLVGAGWEGSQLRPVAGMAVPVIDMPGASPAEGATVSNIGIYGGGSTGVPAIRANAYMPLIDRVRIESWIGTGISSTAPDGVHVHIRDTRIVNVTGTGVTMAATISTMDNVISSNGGANGFWLRAAPTIGGNGVLNGCSFDVNGGHGMYVTGGKWVFNGCYGEANTGDVLRVDGTQDFATSITLSAGASAGATSLSITALAKQLPERTVLRFVDGTVCYNQNLVAAGATSLTLVTPLTNAQSSGAVITITEDDLNPAMLPTVIFLGGYLDGSIYLKACHYMFVGCVLPVGGNGITATSSARQIPGGDDIWTAKQRPRAWAGIPGSKSLQTSLGETHPMPDSAMQFICSPLAQYELGNANGTRVSDPTALAGFSDKLAAQFQYTGSSEGWLSSAMPVGEYLIRAHVKNASMESGAVQIRANVFQGGGLEVNKTLTTISAGWEWVEMDYSHTAARKTPGGAIAIQRLGSTDVYVDAIVIIPKPQAIASSSFIKSGVYTTANRPSAASIGIGGSIYDSTLGIQIWSNGTVYKNAAGTTV